MAFYAKGHGRANLHDVALRGWVRLTSGISGETCAFPSAVEIFEFPAGRTRKSYARVMKPAMESLPMSGANWGS